LEPITKVLNAGLVKTSGPAPQRYDLKSSKTIGHSETIVSNLTIKSTKCKGCYVKLDISVQGATTW